MPKSSSSSSKPPETADHTQDHAAQQPARKKPGPAPKQPAYSGPSPFSSVLAEYMWQSRDSRNRPVGVGQLAVRLGVPRPTVNTWIHRNVVPDLDVVLAVLRTLNIPVERLFAYYRASGLEVPPLTTAEAQVRTAATTATATATATAQTAQDETPTAPLPALQRTTTTALPPVAAASSASEPWDAMVNATVASLREAGVPDSAIAATVERIRTTQAGQSQHPNIARHIEAEHAQPTHINEQQQQQTPTNQRDSQSAQPRTTHGAGR